MNIIRVILMVLLTLGVIAGTGWLAMMSGGPDHDPETAKIDRLIRLLGDTDPDVARDAGKELELLRPASEPALEEAVRSKDEVLAKRAIKILGLGLETPPPHLYTP